MNWNSISYKNFSMLEPSYGHKKLQQCICSPTSCRQDRGLSSQNNFLSPAPAFYKTWFRFSHSYRENFNNNSLFLAHFISNQICLSFNECYRHRFPIHHLSSLTTDCLFQMKELIFWLFVTNLSLLESKSKDWLCASLQALALDCNINTKKLVIKI